MRREVAVSGGPNWEAGLERVFADVSQRRGILMRHFGHASRTWSRSSEAVAVVSADARRYPPQPWTRSSTSGKYRSIDLS